MCAGVGGPSISSVSSFVILHTNSIDIIRLPGTGVHIEHFGARQAGRFKFIPIQGRSPIDEDLVRCQQGDMRGRVLELCGEHFPHSDCLRIVPACRCKEAVSLCMTGSYFLLPMAQTTLAITATGCLLRLLRAMSDYTAERVRIFFPTVF